MSELSSLLVSGTKVLFRWSSGFFPSVLLWGTWKRHSTTVNSRNLPHTTTPSKILQFKRENRSCILRYYCMPIVHHASYMTTILYTTAISQSVKINKYFKLDNMKILFSFYIFFYPNRPLVPQWTALNPWGEKRGFIFNVIKLWVHAHKQQHGNSRKGYTV